MQLVLHPGHALAFGLGVLLAGSLGMFAIDANDGDYLMFVVVLVGCGLVGLALLWTWLTRRAARASPGAS